MATVAPEPQAESHSALRSVMETACRQRKGHLSL